MAEENIKAIIELSNVKIKCIIFKNDVNLKTEILSSSICDSKGIHNGVIVNSSQASDVIRACLSEAEKKANVTLKKINVIIEQPEFLCTKFSKNRKINGSKIQKEDISFLLKEAKKQVTLNDPRQSIIHIFNHNYIVDGKTFLKEPINIYADHLSHEMTFVTSPKNIIKNINQVFLECDIEIERIISGIFALGAFHLNETELNLGSILIDIGFEKVSLGMFKQFALVHSFTLPIGINHLIKDISRVCALTLEESEKIVKEIKFSDKIREINKKKILPEHFFISSKFRKITLDLIYDVIQSRLEEIFEILYKEIKYLGLKKNSGQNIFIVGGGSNLSYIREFSSILLEVEVKKLLVEKNDTINIVENFKYFSSCLGALKIINSGWETEAIPEKNMHPHSKLAFFSKIFGIKD